MSSLVATCGVCLAGLGDSPVEGREVGAHIVTVCGHLFHQQCWDQLILTRGGMNYVPCPLCRVHNNFVGDTRRVYPNFTDEGVDIRAENSSLKQDLEAMKNKVAELEKGAVGVGGSRILRNKRFEDSVCFNCESSEHETSECQMQCFIRNTDNTSSEIFEPIGKYSFQIRLPGRPAGKVVSFYQNTLRFKLNREGVQLAFAFYYFDDGCWNCGNPFHHRPDCVKEANSVLHGIAKKMHEVNHPLPPAQLMKRLEKNLRFGKRGTPN